MGFGKRWWWVIVLCVVLGAALGYEVAKRTPAVYQASIILIVGDETSPSKVEVHDVQASVSLAGMYGALIRSQPVLERVTHQLGLGVSWQTLKDRVHVDPGQNDPVIRISALATSGSRARNLATAIAKQTVALGPEGADGPSAAQTRAFLAGQVSTLQNAIAGVDNEISRLQADVHSSDTHKLRSRIQLVTDWQGTYIAFSHLLSSGGSPNTVRILGNASSTTKIRPFTRIDTAIGGGLGALAGVTLLQTFLVRRRRRAAQRSDGSIPREQEWIVFPRGTTKGPLDPWIPELAGLPSRRVQSTRSHTA
jgi:hypothetical protein